MAQAKRTGVWARIIRFSVAAMVATLLGAATVAHAQCTNCTAVGTGALTSVTTASDDSAFGFNALNADTTGGGNTATGAFALENNTTGDGNTANGFIALFANTTGHENTATGHGALTQNTTGVDNTATGSIALTSNTTGDNNTATGDTALLNNTTGDGNTATGASALRNATGSNNVAVGVNAGENLTTGDNNIDIGSQGVAGESNTIRIGTQGTQTATFIAGIFGTPKIKKACQVVVEPTGQVGCVKSSARYKRDIRDMGNASDKLMKLRPVTFRYKADSTDTQQYGLIAEEVEKVYPELVIEGDDGRPDTVEYQVLPAMLLNEVQKQAKEKDAQIVALRRQVVSQQQQISALQKKDAQIDALAERMNALERQVRLARPEHLASAMH